MASVNVEETIPKSQTMKVSLSHEAIKAMKAQGINLSELLQQQTSIVESGGAKPYASVKRNVEKGKKAESSPPPSISNSLDDEDDDDDDIDDIHQDKVAPPTVNKARNEVAPIQSQESTPKVGSNLKKRQTTISIESKLNNLIESRRESSSLTSGKTAEGVTLKAMLEYLVEKLGYPKLFDATKLKCFALKPSITSSLKVLRQPEMEWAKKKVEELYVKNKK